MRQIYGTCNGYLIEKEISTTQISKVRLAYKDNEIYAFKYLEKDVMDFKLLQNFFIHEIKSLSLLHHDHIVRMIDSSNDAEIILCDKTKELQPIHVMYILVEYLSGGSMFDIITLGN